MAVKKPEEEYKEFGSIDKDPKRHIDFLEYIETFNPPGMNYDIALGHYGDDMKGAIDIRDIVTRVLGEGRYFEADTEVKEREFIGERDKLYRRALDEMNRRDDKFEAAKILVEEAQYRNELDMK